MNATALVEWLMLLAAYRAVLVFEHLNRHCDTKGWRCRPIFDARVQLNEQKQYAVG